jgi:hypothetical protein
MDQPNAVLAEEKKAGGCQKEPKDHVDVSVFTNLCSGPGRNYAQAFVFTTGHIVSCSAEVHMDWNRAEGNWKEIAGRAKEKRGRVADYDLAVMSGR